MISFGVLLTLKQTARSYGVDSLDFRASRLFFSSLFEDDALLSFSLLLSVSVVNPRPLYFGFSRGRKEGEGNETKRV